MRNKEVCCFGVYDGSSSITNFGIVYFHDFPFFEKVYSSMEKICSNQIKKDTTVKGHLFFVK